MADPEAFLKAFAAVVSATFALVVLMARPRSSPQVFLAFFLLLIGGNQAAEAIRSATADPAARAQWLRAAGVCAALDPPVLAYYVALLAPDGVRRHRAALLAFGLTGVALSGAYALAPGAREDAPQLSALLAATTLLALAAYSWALGLALRRDADEKSPRTRLLIHAMVLAAIPIWPRSLPEAQVALQGVFGGLWLQRPWLQLVQLAALAIVTIGFLLAARAQGEATFAIAQRATLLAVLVAFAIDLSSFRAALFTDAPPAALRSLGRVGSAVRWLAFAGIMSVATLRYEGPRLSLARRRLSARLLIALAFVGTLVGMLVAFPAISALSGFDSAPLLVVMVLVVLAASQGFRGLVDATAEALYRVPAPGSIEARHSAYRAAVVEALRQGTHPRTSDVLIRLRKDLLLDESAARAIEESAELTTPTSTGEGQLIAGRYRIGHMIGRGGHGRVLLAHDELLGRRVVIKEVLTSTEGREAGFVAEARAAATVQHPNVITIYDVLLRPGVVLLVEEHAPGGSLEEKLRRAGALDSVEATRVVAAILRGLSALHARGVVHGDLKPANVLFGADGEAKICDFGISVLRTGETLHVTALPGPSGTPGFAAPEQLAGEVPSRRADIYAMGHLLRACWGARLPAGVAAIVTRATDPDPRGRYEDADQLRDALERVLDGTDSDGGRRQ